MGSADEQMFERQERRRNEIIANYLGVTTEDIAALDLEVHANTTSDGAESGYYIEFPDHAPEVVLRRIDGLTDRTVYLPLGIFDEGERE